MELRKYRFTLAEAIDRVGLEWLALIPRVTRQLRDKG